MAESDIEWLRCPCCGRKGSSWNPVTGCDTVSPGCDYCYARTMAKRLKGMGQPRYQLDGRPPTSGPGFGVQEHPDLLTLPLSWRQHRRVFPTSMSDLFHPRVSDDFIARVFATMALTHRHTYVSTTKRAARMDSLLNRAGFVDAVAEHASALIGSRAWKRWQLDLGGQRLAGDSGLGGGWTGSGGEWRPPWPLPNVWLGVSVEDQQRADERIPRLLRTPAAVRWISAEPLLGPIDLAGYLPRPAGAAWFPVECRHGYDGCPICDRALAPADALSWIVVGGESGHNARPMHPKWARSLRDQAVAAGAPFFYKQSGSHAVVTVEDAPDFAGGRAYRDPKGGRSAAIIREEGGPFRTGTTRPLRAGDRTRRLTMLDDDTAAIRVTGHGGRLLDGQEWNESPAAPVAVVAA